MDKERLTGNLVALGGAVVVVLLLVWIARGIVSHGVPAAGGPATAEAWTSQEVDGWTFWAGDALLEPSVVSEYETIQAEEGFAYAFIPVRAQNTTMATASFPWLDVWMANDGRGYVYDRQLSVELCLPTGACLDLVNVPPGALREGAMVFEIREDTTELYLTCLRTGVRLCKPWHITVSPPTPEGQGGD